MNPQNLQKYYDRPRKTDIRNHLGEPHGAPSPLRYLGNGDGLKPTDKPEFEVLSIRISRSLFRRPAGRSGEGFFLFGALEVFFSQDLHPYCIGATETTRFPCFSAFSLYFAAPPVLWVTYVTTICDFFSIHSFLHATANRRGTFSKPSG